MIKKDYCIILTTTDDRQTATKIAENLVNSSLAACCSISSKFTSVYKWKGKTEIKEEYQLQIKSRIDFYMEIEDAILNLHNYDIPEIIMIPIENGNPEYLKWIDESLT